VLLAPKRGLALAIAVLVWACAPTPSSRHREAPTGHPAPPESLGSAAELDSAADVDSALSVLRAYYAAINRREYERAYRLWGGEGADSRQTLEAFRKGFARTTSVELTIEKPGRIEGAAGSRYLDLPIALVAKEARGRTRHYRGTYTMRRAVVDGASFEQRSWRIYTATVVATD